MTEKRILTRRTLLRNGVATTVALTTVSGSASSWASPDMVEREIWRRIGSAKPIDSRVTLDLPSFAENGNLVPLTVRVESPMTETDYVESIHVFAEWNPFAVVGAFYFTPESGKAEVTTRIRLAKTQEVTAIARMSDGKVYRAVAQIDITIGGCEP
jgi:sulfur-oxidizing protein SoxY